MDGPEGKKEKGGDGARGGGKREPLATRFREKWRQGCPEQILRTRCGRRAAGNVLTLSKEEPLIPITQKSKGAINSTSQCRHRLEKKKE